MNAHQAQKNRRVYQYAGVLILSPRLPRGSPLQACDVTQLARGYLQVPVVHGDLLYRLVSKEASALARRPMEPYNPAIFRVDTYENELAFGHSRIYSPP